MDAIDPKTGMVKEPRTRCRRLAVTSDGLCKGHRDGAGNLGVTRKREIVNEMLNGGSLQTPTGISGIGIYRATLTGNGHQSMDEEVSS